MAATKEPSPQANFAGTDARSRSRLTAHAVDAGNLQMTSDNPSLRRWRVIEVVSQNGTRTRHVYGHDAVNSVGRASSAITGFDRKAMTVTTRSGKTYTLLGAPGKARIGEHAWQTWCKNNGVVSETDVTDEYFSIDKLFAKPPSRGKRDSD